MLNGKKKICKINPFFADYIFQTELNITYAYLTLKMRGKHLFSIINRYGFELVSLLLIVTVGNSYHICKHY